MSNSKPPTILEKIYAQRAQDVELAKKTPGTTPEDIARLLSMHLAPPLIPFVERLRRNPSNVLSGSQDIPSPSLMAEIKRASPSKGPIALTTPVSEQALTYALAGASVISVLTEPHWFKGSLHDMLMVRQSISSIPDRPAVLRKEFILDEYMIAEARLYGADTVLLIVAMMSDELLTRLYKYSLSLGMEPLVEVNNTDEMRRALALGAKVIGVNNRNLHDFNVDMGTTSRLVDMVKEKDVILCALSGISVPQDDTAAFIRELLDWPDLRRSESQRVPIVKVSGVTTPEQAQKIVHAGTSILGLIFDPTLANSVTLEEATLIRNVFPKTTISLVSSPSQQPNVPWFHAHLSAILLKLTNQRPLIVGHFTTHTSHTLQYILEAIATASLDLVQFDGAVPADWARFIPVPVIRRFSSPLSTQSIPVAVTDTPTTTAIVQGINDSSQANRPGLHAIALIDLTVASGSNTVYVPSKDQDSSSATALGAAPDTGFILPLKQQGPYKGTSKGVEGTKRLVSAGELGGRWSMPVLVTAGQEQLKPDVVREIGAWGIDLDIDGANGLEEYIKALRA
ncbi:Anthranilate synthase component 2 [Leucoagaricus sp. SymC.cos]|nr:Anthranilate synthase component 2 [Leucoagaricus sp. SymC.cos]